VPDDVWLAVAVRLAVADWLGLPEFEAVLDSVTVAVTDWLDDCVVDGL
jgi:hypothetical protein